MHRRIKEKRRETQTYTNKEIDTYTNKEIDTNTNTHAHTNKQRNRRIYTHTNTQKQDENKNSACLPFTTCCTDYQGAKECQQIKYQQKNVNK